MALALALSARAGDAKQIRLDLDGNKEDLNISVVMSENVPGADVVFPKPFNYMRLVKEAKFVKYGIDIFERSVYRKIGRDDYDKLAGLVTADAKKAVAKEVIYREGRLVYALLQMPPRGKINRFIAFQSGKEDLTVVYMEGPATLEELEKIFAKQ